MPTEDQAVRLLEELGLTQYEARCLVALSRVGNSTAKQISDLSEVPRSRVYDAVEGLHKRGLVDVQQSEPREYRAVSKDEILETLRRDYRSTVTALDTALNGLRTKNEEELEEHGAWAIADHDNVTHRMTSLIDDAESEVYLLVSDEDLVEEAVYERLAAATDRGVEVVVEVPSVAVREAIREVVPGATVHVSEMAEDANRLGGKCPGRTLMVDREAVLLSAVADSSLPGQTEETAIWAKGPDHGLVVGVRELLGTRLGKLENE
jgi:sugar-specific transcriptional regulator TrmB